MKRLTMLVVAGMMGLFLVACGDNAPKAPAPKTETTTVTTETQPAAEPATVVEPAATPTDTSATDGAQSQE